MIETEVLVLGGGMAGMTLGNALAGAGVATVVVDSSPPEALLDAGYDGRASAIAWGSAQVFKGIGLWPYLESEAGPILDIRVADGTLERGPSMLFLHYDHADIGDEPFGYMIENRATRRGLFEQAKAWTRCTAIAGPGCDAGPVGRRRRGRTGRRNPHSCAPCGGRGRTAIADPRIGRHRGVAPGLQPDRHRLHRRP